MRFPRGRHRDARGLALGARPSAASGSCVPSAARSAGCSSSPRATRRSAYQARFNENVAAHYDALETLRAVLALPAMPRRIECFDISTIQGSETVASMVVCEDGRMKRASTGSSGSGARGSGSGLGARANSDRMLPPSPAPTPTRAVEPRTHELHSHDDFASMHEVVLRRYRKLLEHGGPFPDLDPDRRRQGAADGRLRGARGARPGEPVAVGIAKKEELLFTRDRVDAIALPRDSPALLLIQRIRDEAHRFAVTFHRQSRTKRDLRSELDTIAGVGPRRRKALLDGVRQRRRRAPRDARGARARRRREDAPTPCSAHFAGSAG